MFPAKRLCVLPSMEGVRWAFSCGTWLPSRAEWLLAVRSIQPEEKERIGQFVFARDAKAAMVLEACGSGGAGRESSAGWRLRRARPASAFVSEASSPGMLSGEGRPLKTGVRSNRLFSNAYALKVKSLEVTKYTVCTVGFYVF